MSSKHTTSTTHISTSEAETERIAAALAGGLQAGTVVALHGDLGAGKTRFVRGLAIGLGHDPDLVSSPTFVIEHRYQAAGAVPLVHIDAYRIANSDDLQTIGWDELVAAREAIMAVEWAERISSELPAARCVHVHLRHCEAGREIEIIAG